MHTTDLHDDSKLHDGRNGEVAPRKCHWSIESNAGEVGV